MVLVDASHPDQWAFAPPEFLVRAPPSPSMGLHTALRNTWVWRA